MFDGIEDVQARLTEQRYVCDRRLATVVFLATRIGKPILVEGPAGVGKTELAKALGGRARHRADPPAVLRGARRGQGAVRVGVRQAAALHAGAAREDRRAARAGRETSTTPPSCCAARRTSSSPSASSSSARSCARCAPSARRSCSSTRSTAPTRSSRRSCSSSCRTSRSRSPRSGRSGPTTAAARGAHEQPLARAQRGAQAPLPAPAARLSRAGGGARDRPPQGARDPRRARRRARRDDPAAADGSTCARRRASARPSTGPRRSWSSAPTRSTKRAHRGDAQRDRQVRPRRREGARGARSSTAAATAHDHGMRTARHGHRTTHH